MSPRNKLFDNSLKRSRTELKISETNSKQREEKVSEWEV